jgi:predicted phage-related endonuclease
MLDLIQGSPEWLAARCGSLGASQVADALARTKTGWGASRANAKARLITERLTGKPTESFVTSAMMRGTELEPVARAMYSFHSGHDVTEIGIVLHPVIQGTHCSPDGLIGGNGMVEIKCCGAARHIEILTGDKPEDRYIKQCLWQLACTGREWVDLAYFNPDLPDAMQLHVTRIDRDDAVITEMEDQVAAFLAEVAATMNDLTTRYMKEEAA